MRWDNSVLMLIIDNIIVSHALIKRTFVCNLTACKGACCIEGDQGAPLNEDELPVLDALQDAIAPFITDEGKKALREQGPYTDDVDGYHTTLREDGACAYVNFDEKGIAYCGIEKAYNAGKVNFKKPLSCHLYPIRVQPLHEGAALNYSEWDICDPACKLGEALQVPVYQFLKDALIRAYGEDWYAALEEAVKLHTYD